MYGWLITKETASHGTGAKSRVGWTGPRNTTMTPDQIRTHPDKKEFRMLDDDGEVYYEGILAGDAEGFEPLDDLGRPDAGCTIIQFMEDGVWKTL